MKLQIAGHQTESYRVATEVYEGPLDLLLDLIERAELDITTLALAQVTDQYLSYLRALQEQDPAEVSAFLVIAAKLIQIKSVHLLPRPPIKTEEEEDSAEQLVQQLILYKKFKQAALFLEQKEIDGSRTYLRLTPPSVQVESRLDLSGVTLVDLLQAAQATLIGNKNLVALDTVVNMPRVTIREKIRTILDILQKKKTTSFEKILKSSSRIEIVVTFLALLELVKRRIIEVQQNALFDDIEMKSSEVWQEVDDIQLDFEE